jgi:hypothetical protein
MKWYNAQGQSFELTEEEVALIAEKTIIADLAWGIEPRNLPILNTTWL